MTKLFFSAISPIYSIELQPEYSLVGVIISIIVACIASFTALSLNERVQKNSFFHYLFWLILASISLGLGIWAMHFVGMTAITLPISMHYNWILTFVSLIPGVLASFIFFYWVNKPIQSWWKYIIASILMGLGIAGVHYIGIRSMEMDVQYVYDRPTIFIALCISIMFTQTALFSIKYSSKKTKNFITKTFSSILMGCAIATTHYVGILAISVYAPRDYLVATAENHSMHNTFLGVTVTFFLGMLIGVLLLSSMMDRYVKYRANYFDNLTMLPNRRSFESYIEKSVIGQTLAVWHLHDFGKINQEFSFMFGDEVIQHLTKIFTDYKPPSARLFKFESNRFAYIMRTTDDTNIHEMLIAMEKIAEILKRPITIKNKKIVLPGVCAISAVKDYRDLHSIYSNALAVFNDSSIEHKHEVIMFDPVIHTHTFEKELVDGIEKAMINKELYLVYQPKINLRNVEVAGVEVLLRWNNSKYGFLSPAVFVPILEENSKMEMVTDWIVEQACKQMYQWKKENISLGKVAINIPGHYVTSSALLKRLISITSSYEICPNEIELEITETSFVSNIEEAMRAVGVFREKGFSVALDDFGTGVSSLSYLKQIPISTLKIDKTFIEEVPNSHKDSLIVQAIIALGTSLGLEIVFEGVETKEQVGFLRASCENPILQGYYFAKPMRAEELFHWQENIKQKFADKI